MMPVLGVPIVNGFNWMQRLVSTIDFPIENLIIINNNSNDEELTENLRNLSNSKYDNITNIKLCNLPSNLGVAASWNLIIKSTIESPYWLICNNDIGFTPGVLQNFYEESQKKENGIIFGGGGDFGDGSYDLFMIKDWVIQKIGLFDENFYPAYCEDADYIMRLHNYNIKNSNNPLKTICLNKPYYHGDSLSTEADCYLNSGSQTSRKSPELKKELDRVHLMNHDYMSQKWGPGWRMTNPYASPMNNNNIPITYTTFDLEFARSKYISFKIEKENKMNSYYIDHEPNAENGFITTNKFSINKKKESRFFVVDNFYEDPVAVREFALSQIYFPGEGAVGYRTRKQFIFEGVKERFEEIIGLKILEHTDKGHGWLDGGVNGRFQSCAAGTPLVYHCDDQQWAGMVYLTPDAPPSCGTSFFRHKNSKIHHNSQVDWNDPSKIVFNQKTFLDRTPYELVDSIGNVFNRLVIFDGGLIHSASEYFGWDIPSSRLFHMFFFNTT